MTAAIKGSQLVLSDARDTYAAGVDGDCTEIDRCVRVGSMYVIGVRYGPHSPLSYCLGSQTDASEDILAVDLARKRVAWTHRYPASRRIQWASPRQVLEVRDWHLFALDTATGRETSTPLWAWGRLFSSDGRRAVVLEEDGRLEALDLTTGDSLWRKSIDTGASSKAFPGVVKHARAWSLDLVGKFVVTLETEGFPGATYVVARDFETGEILHREEAWADYAGGNSSEAEIAVIDDTRIQVGVRMTMV